MKVVFDDIANNKKKLFFIILITGIFLRVLASLQGFNIDMEYWRFGADLLKYGGKPFDTNNLPYGPLWIHILFYLDKIPFFVSGEIESLRYKVMLFLTLVDIVIFYLAIRLHSLTVGLLFFLNPVSIFITGFHSQFGNLAVLIGFLGVIYYENNNNNKGFAICNLLLGVSLFTKHILIFFPLWLAIKEKNWFKKILFCTLPYIIFYLSFLPFETDLNTILINIFGYESHRNAIFWKLFSPEPFINYIGFKNLFILSIILMGFVFEKESKIKSFYFYLISLVLFGMSTANQYLAIPIVAIAFFWNRFFFLYTVSCCLFFLVDTVGLNIEYLQNLVGWTRNATRIGYKIIIIFLTLGFLQSIIGKKKFNLIIIEIYNYVTKKFKNQFSIK